VADPGASSERATVFSDTRGLLKFSAGEGQVAGVANQADLGTAFALATSLYGKSLLQVSGNLGYGSQTGVPSAAFRTSYSRDMDGNKPVFSVTMRQLYLPERMGEAMGGSEAALPMLRSISAGADNRTQLADNVAVQYGFTMNSMFFVDHLNYTSPYARLTWNVNQATDVEVAYTSGDARSNLAEGGLEDAKLQQNVDNLALFPRISMTGGRPKIQRADDYEVAVTRRFGSRSLRLSAYRELLRNAALTMVAPDGMFAGSGDVLPDLFSNTSVIDGGNFDNVGYNAAFTQKLGEHVAATVVYGNEGTLSVANRELVSETPDELRAMIHAGRRHAGAARLSGTLPWTGTKFMASYQWTNDPRSLMGGNLYSAQSLQVQPGLNFCVRQPLPGFGGRLEATADIRNMLAQGYIPVTMAGAQLLLMDNPRSVRGGLAFTF
jgi:hypothetical protein